MSKEKFTVRFYKTESGADATALSGVPYFSAAQTFDCGQCFRWNEVHGGIEGIAFGRFIRVEEDGGEVRLIGVSERDYREIFERYLGLCEDYGAIRADIGEKMGADGDVIFKAMECDYSYNKSGLISIETTEFNFVIDLNQLALFVIESQFEGFQPRPNHIERLLP